MMSATETAACCLMGLMTVWLVVWLFSYITRYAPPGSYPGNSRWQSQYTGSGTRRNGQKSEVKHG